MNTNTLSPLYDGSYRFGSNGASASVIAQSLPLTSFHPPSLARLAERRGSLPLSPIQASPPSATDGSESGIESASSYNGTFYQRLRIEVNQPVGNMSISPANRDIVLGARKGLFIIDLEHPYETPRFLPQGGTWEVADVQWNPHPARANLIVSTSSQKLLIWDLYLTGQTAITRILNAHYRAITDVNWSSFDPDVIASCGIDSWIWAWDLRAGDKPVFGLSAWDAPATQVKWNRQDRHMLASSHDDKVLIWDDRKGSVPLTTIHAHSGARIYGIDWSRKYRNEIVTCSLDKTIKFWKIDSLSRTPHSPLDPILPDDTIHTARAVIHTRYPVWRARHLPFGHGVLSLPQRGINSLEMYCPEQPNSPIYKAEGHTDVVKEYVWRTKGGDDPENDDREFQLITWSKDRTLRLWPIDATTMKAAGFVQGAPIKILVPRRGATNETFRTPPKLPVQQKLDPQPMLSAPSANRGILAGVRAGAEVHLTRSSGTATASRNISGKGTPSPSDRPLGEVEKKRKGTMDTIRFGLSESTTPTQYNQAEGTRTAGTFMTRGKFGGGKPGAAAASGLGVDTIGWFSAVKVEKLEPGGGSNGGDSGPVSRLVSRSRGASVDINDFTEGGRRRSASQSINSDFVDHEKPEHMADEIAIIGRKFGTRVTCERADVIKKRSCTFTLLGPWRDDCALTFIRITFEFPKDYWKPTADPLTSIPSFDLDKIVGISMKTRAFLLKKLKAIRVQRRPCLEPCLRFLLGEGEGGYGFVRSEGSASDDESEDIGVSAVGEGSGEGLAEDRGVTKEGGTLVKNSPENTPRPRRSQGIWGPNGELVCFFLTVPTKNYPSGGRRNASPSPSIGSRGTPGNVARIRPFSSVAGTISHALRGLSRLTNDGSGVPMEPGSRLKRGTPFMDTLFMGSMLRSSTRESRDTRASSAHVSNRPISSVSIKTFHGLTLLDKNLGRDYTVMSEDNPAKLCFSNARISREHQRYDHERAWTILYRLFCPMVPANSVMANYEPKDERNEDDVPITERAEKRMLDGGHSIVRWGSHPLAKQTTLRLYEHFSRAKDVQMLAMLSVVLLEVDRVTPRPKKSTPFEPRRDVPMEPVHSILPVNTRLSIDYFSLRLRDPALQTSGSTSPSWPRLSSFAPTSSLSLSFSPSRNSWTSIVLPKTLLGAGNSTTTAGVRESVVAPPHINTNSQRQRTVSSATTVSVGTPDGSRTPLSISTTLTDIGSRSIPVPAGRVATPDSPKKKASTLLGRSTEQLSNPIKAWGSEPSAPASSRINIGFASGGHGFNKRWTLTGNGSRKAPSSTMKEKKKVISVTMSADEEVEALYYSPFVEDATTRATYEAHIIAYAEVLLRWEFVHKRAELLKNIGWTANLKAQKLFVQSLNGIDGDSQLQIGEMCSMCSAELRPEQSGRCIACRTKNIKTRCGVCRLPVPGLSHACLRCCHVTHLDCWRNQKLKTCPTGCGCDCSTFAGSFQVDGMALPLPSTPPLQPYTPDVISPTATILSQF